MENEAIKHETSTRLLKEDNIFMQLCPPPPPPPPHPSI